MHWKLGVFLLLLLPIRKWYSWKNPISSNCQLTKICVFNNKIQQIGCHFIVWIIIINGFFSSHFPPIMFFFVCFQSFAMEMEWPKLLIRIVSYGLHEFLVNDARKGTNDSQRFNRTRPIHVLEDEKIKRGQIWVCFNFCFSRTAELLYCCGV